MEEFGRGRIVGTTGEHPFWVVGKGWVRASSLRIGDELASADGQKIAVEGIAPSGRTETVYNLEVESDHTYFVGEPAWHASLWAHNAGADEYGAGKKPPPVEEEANKTAKDKETSQANGLGEEKRNGIPTGVPEEDLPAGTRDRGKNLGQEQGREGRPDQLETYEFDMNQPRHVRGWLKNERRMVEQGRLPDGPRTPSGYQQAHGRTTPAREGYDYSNSRLQGKDLNMLEETVRRRAGVP